MWKIPDFISEEDLTDRPLILRLILASVLQTSVTYSQETRPVLTNQDIATLSVAGVPEQVLLKAIKAAEDEFDVSGLALANLKRDGISDELIGAILRAKANPKRT